MSDGSTADGTNLFSIYKTISASTPVTVDVPPTIVAQKALFAGKGRRRRLVGFELDFSKALDPVRAGTMANYEITQTVRHGRKRITQSVGLSVSYDATTEGVVLTPTGRTKFSLGGQLTVLARPPGGLTDLAGMPLDGGSQGVPGDDATFAIGLKGATISR